MQLFREIAPEELTLNPFQAIGKDWMLVTAANEGKVNPMTASWGGLGVLWHKPVAFVFLRPGRLTRELVDREEALSLAFLDPERYRKQMNLCGTHSGRDVDKMAECGFDAAYEGGVPYLTQAHTVLICRKLYRQPLEVACFVYPEIEREHYGGKDHHVLYVAEIEKVLVKG